MKARVKATGEIIELYRLEKTRRYKLNLDAEMMAELAHDLRGLQREIEDECRYILGIEED